MTTYPNLGYGYNEAVPDEATSAWGARAIINDRGYVDIVGNRTDRFGDPNFLTDLAEAFPPKLLVETIRNKIASGEIKTYVGEHVDLFDNGDIVVVANSKGSDGYLYLAAYRL